MGGTCVNSVRYFMHPVVSHNYYASLAQLGTGCRATQPQFRDHIIRDHIRMFLPRYEKDPLLLLCVEN